MSWKPIRIILLLMLGSLLLQAEDSPSRQAVEARIDLYGTATVRALEAGETLDGLLTVNRPSWMKSTDQIKSYSLTFPITHFSTNQFSFRFIPKASGKITLSLLGPYDKVPGSSNTLYRQEVLWELIETTGATLVGESGALLQLPVTSWLRQRYDLGLNVTGGQAVVLRCAARALPVGNPHSPELKAGSERPTASIPDGFRKGVRILQGIELVRPKGQLPDLSQADLTAIQSEGFDHVRLSLPWHEALPSSGGAPDAATLARLDLVLNWAAQAQIGVILGCQAYPELAADTAKELPRFVSLWRYLAHRYSNSPCRLAFELISPGGKRLPTATLNALYAETLREIRPIVGQRWVFVSPGKSGHPAELPLLSLPEGDDRIAVSVQSREPEFFTQQLSQGLKSYGLEIVRFPGPAEQPLKSPTTASPDLNTRELIRRYQSSTAARNPSSAEIVQRWVQWTRDWSQFTGRPVYQAEVGCVAAIEASSRSRYYAAWREALDKSGMGWAIADWRQDFRYWDPAQQRPMSGMREALFPGRAVLTPSPAAATETPAQVDSALTQLRALRKQTLPPPVNKASPPSDPMATLLAQVQERSDHNWKLTRWTLGAMLGISITLLILPLMRNRPAVEIVTTTRILSRNALSDQEREITLTQVTELLKEKLVLHLLASRKEGQLAQQQASEEVELMGRRLEQLRAPLQEKVHAYERRIAELEEDLLRMGKQNRDLIRAKIEMTKQRITAPPRATRPEELN